MTWPKNASDINVQFPKAVARHANCTYYHLQRVLHVNCEMVEMINKKLGTKLKMHVQ